MEAYYANNMEKGGRFKNNSRHSKPQTCLRNLRSYFCDFCNNTTIHGLKFIGENGRYAIERIFWLLLLFMAVYSSGYLINKSFERWMSAPVIVTFATRETPIWEIPFPAITICPEIKTYPDVFNYTDVFLKYDMEVETTEEEDMYFNLYSMVCNPYMTHIDENITATITDDELSTFVNSLADFSVYYCKWIGVEQDCGDMFSYTLTSEGLCFTFNKLKSEEIYFDVNDVFENRTRNDTRVEKWSLEDGYRPDAELDTYPRRTLISGSKAGFAIDLFIDHTYVDYLCDDLQGFKVAIHHPADVPNMNNYLHVALNQVVAVGVKPKMMTTAQEVKNYRPEDRQCYLPGEKVLSNFKIYTQQNCISECLWNYTLALCGCIRFDMHSKENGTNICGAGRKFCVENATVSFLREEVSSKMQKSEKGTSGQCGCLPACTSVEFETETSQTHWNYKLTYQLYENGSAGVTEEDHFSRLTVYYKEMQFMTSERHELHGTLDFLANCGGLLGLFCGFSFMSIIEIFYYLTLRLACNLKKFGGRFWSGDPELVEEIKSRNYSSKMV